MTKFLLLFSLLFHFNAVAQKVVVFDGKTKMPLEGVSVSYSDQTKVSNLDGELEIENLDDEKNITFSLLGYKNVRLPFKELKNKSFKVYLEHVVDLHEVVISNTKWNQNQSVVPKNIVKTTSKEVEIFNPQTAADLLQKTGKVFVQKSQSGGGSPMIRGFSTNRLLISVDGVRMNNAIFRSGNLQNIISVDPFTIENAEVILGPGSVVYGSDAIGGTINFLTKEPKFGLTDKVKAKGKGVYRFSSANLEQTVHASASLSAKKWASLTSFSFSDFDNLKQGSNGPSEYLRNQYVVTNGITDAVANNSNPKEQINSSFSQLNFLQKINLKLHDNLKVGFDLTYNTTSNYDRYDQLLRREDDGSFRSAEWFYGPQKWLKVSNKIDFEKHTLLFNSLRLTNSFQFFEESRNTRDFGSMFRDVNTEQLNAYNLNLDAEKKYNRHSFYYGFEYVHNKVNSIASVFDISTNTSESSIYTRYPDDSTWQSVAAYLVANTKFNNKLSASAGLRYNRILLFAEFLDSGLGFPFTETDLNTGALTGSLGLTYAVSNHLMFKGNIGTAFRAPNIDDIGKITQDSQPGTLVVPNPNLKSEYAYNSEFSVSYSTKKSEFTFAGFYTFLENAITTDTFRLSGNTTIEFRGEESEIIANQNTKELFTYGVELSGKVRLMNHLKCTATYTLTKGQENQSDGDKVPVRHVAPAFGSLHVLYEKEKWHIDTYLDFNSGFDFEELAPSEQEKTYIYAIDENGNPFQPSWYTLNVRGNYNVTEKLNLIAGLENITNQRYRTYSSGISSPGINLVTSIRYQF